MKKLLFTSIFIVITNLLFAQVILSKDGFTSDHTDFRYVVFELPNKSQKELFDKTKTFLYTKFSSPKDAISDVDSSLITITGFSEKAIRRNGMHVFDMNYTLSIQFKSGKIKINAPSFSLETFTDKKQELHVCANNSIDGRTLGIYKTDGRLRSKMAKNDLEIFFNGFINDILTSLKTEIDSNW